MADTTPLDDQFLTSQELADRYGVTARTVKNWRARGKGPRYFRAGMKIRYRLSDVLAYETARTRGGEVA